VSRLGFGPRALALKARKDQNINGVGIWPAGWLCEALGVSRAGFYAWRTRPPSARARAYEQLLNRVRASFLSSDRTYGARRGGHPVIHWTSRWIPAFAGMTKKGQARRRRCILFRANTVELIPFLRCTILAMN
jgi:hypothetical protein